jgi:Rieske Fe-S protein
MSIEVGPTAAAEGASESSLVDEFGSGSAGVSRRAVLRAAALAGAGVPLLAACGSGSADASAPDSTSKSGRGSGGGTPTPSDTSASNASGGSSSALATTSQVPKGGGIILPDAGVVITQPSAGTFEGFSSTCTHMGCTLNDVSDGTINCICHGSQFSIKNGSVVTGPATVPLPKKPLAVKGKDITLK